MSKTRIEDSLRLAIYEAYKGKCFYTEEPVSYRDYELDHIIPESLEGIKFFINWNNAKDAIYSLYGYAKIFLGLDSIGGNEEPMQDNDKKILLTKIISQEKIGKDFE